MDRAFWVHLCQLSLPIHNKSLWNKYQCNIHTFGSLMCLSQVWKCITKTNKNNIKVILILLTSARDRNWHSIQTTSFLSIWYRHSLQTLLYASISKRCCPLEVISSLSLSLPSSVNNHLSVFHAFPFFFQQCHTTVVGLLCLVLRLCTKKQSPLAHFLTNSYLRVPFWVFLIKKINVRIG